MSDLYDEKYDQDEYYWGKRPSKICYQVLKLKPPLEKPLKLLVLACGEGRNAVFFARNGYEVTAFDISSVGLEKTKRYAEEVGVPLKTFQADITEFRLEEKYDILFSTGGLQYIPEKSRDEVFRNYKTHTKKDGLNVFSLFVDKPFIKEPPDSEKTERRWVSGELFTHYSDWKIEHCSEEIFDCDSSGVPHRHAVNRIVARKMNVRI